MKRYILPAAITALCVIQTLAGGDHRLVSVLCFMSALISWGALVRSAHKSQFQALRARILIPIVLLAALAMVLIPPATSKDFNSYALYGRMAAEYGASPYSSVPRDFAGDVWFERTSYYWSDSPSVYGPVFAGLSTAVMEVADTSVIKARAGFAAIVMLGFLASIALLSRRLGWASAAVLLGLNPLVLTFGLNDLHCDVLVGTFVLAAVLALERERWVLAGIGLALAASVKISALPALAGAGVWLLFRKGFRPTVAMASAATLVIVVGVLAVGGLESLVPITEAAGRQTRFSLWNPVADVLASWLGSAPPTLGPADRIVGTAASASVAIVGLALIWHYRRAVTPVAAVVAGLVAYQVLGAYTLSWYALWSLPALALVYRSRLAAVCMVHGSWIAIAYLSGWVGLAAVMLAAGAWVLARRRGVSMFPQRAAS